MKKILITGGTRGIGAATLKLFSKRGDRVAFLYKQSDLTAEQLADEYSAIAVKCDIANPEQVADKVKYALDELGGIDVLINNAGISDFALFDTIDEEKWRTMMSVNLDGTYRVTREVVPYMIHNHSGNIVNVSSMWGVSGACMEVHYSTAKAGIIGMTKALAKELGPSGIRVNCVAPGVIDTDMNSSLTPEAIKELENSCALGRIGKPEEIASVIEFLSGEKSSFITGQVITCDGGINI